MICIKNAKVVLPEGILWDGVILIEDDRIISVGDARDVKIPANAEIIDAGGAYVGPGFVDIHVHGGGGYTFGGKDTMKAVEFYLRHGTTTIFPTFYTSFGKEEMLSGIKTVQSHMKEGGLGRIIAGIYMEGPFMNAEFGSDTASNKWRGDITPEVYKELVDTAGDTVKVWAVAPERENIEEFMAYAKKVNPNVHFAVGHSNATPAQIAPLKKYNMNISTHITNAKYTTSEWVGVRGCGPDEDCLYDDSVYAELICDSMGVHVNPFMQKLILKVKGIDKMILITDGSPLTDQPLPEGFEHMTDLAFDENRLLAGSRLTMDGVCKNFMKHTNSGITQAFLAAATNPARAVGIDDEVGSIEKGKKANLIFVDDMFNIKKIMLCGELI